MNVMEQRAWITIANFPPADAEDEWLPFIQALERDSADLGPVLGWEGRDLGQVVMSADVDAESQFAQAAVVRVTEALKLAGLHHLYPTAIELEAVEAETPAPAGA